jgi:hypothetical protein
MQGLWRIISWSGRERCPPCTHVVRADNAIAGKRNKRRQIDYCAIALARTCRSAKPHALESRVFCCDEKCSEPKAPERLWIHSIERPSVHRQPAQRHRFPSPRMVTMTSYNSRRCSTPRDGSGTWH